MSTRDPDLAALLATHRPVASHDTVWAGGTLPLRVSAYPWPTVLPDALVTSVRCLVQVGADIVICENRDGAHPWPGGRREPGETYTDTAVREVHEETGWRLDRASVRTLGWLHYEHLAPRRPDYPFPHPDFLQVVLHATADTRDGDGSWTDLDGYEDRAILLDLPTARTHITDGAVPRAFLDLLT